MSDEPISILTRQLDNRERRKHERKKSILPAVLVTEAGSFDCRVHDFSTEGARVETTARVYPGHPVVLIVGSNRARGGCGVWCAEGTFGMRFSKRQEESAMDYAAAAAATHFARQEKTREQPSPFVEFKRFQGAAVFVNPTQVLYVTSQGDGSYCEIHFAGDIHVTVHGDCKRVCSQLARQ